MARFLICSFALVLLYPSGIDMYLVGLPRIAQDLGASEAQLHIAFSVYLAGMAAAMLFAGRIADKSGRKPVAIFGAGDLYTGLLLCSQAQVSATSWRALYSGDRRGQLLRGGFAMLRDTLDDRRRAKVLSLLNGITCIIPVLAPVLGHLIMLKYPWQSLFYTMTGMGVLVGLLSVFILRETRPQPRRMRHAAKYAPESLLNRFFLSRILITTLSVTAILTYVNVSPVLMMEEMGFDRGTYSMAMALMAMVSMAVSFSTPFALSLFKPRTLMLTSQVLFFIAGVLLSLATSQTSRCWAGLICAGFSVGFGVAMSQALGPFTLRAGVPARSWALLRSAALRCGFGWRPSSDSAR
jgi:DHA1 family multidrug resistance protein-like MFS transporter